LAADPATRRLVATYHHVAASPPHQQEFYSVYNLDTLARERTLDSHLGALTRPAFAGETGRMVGILNAKNGFLGSRLLVYGGSDVKARTSPAPLDGIPVIDARGQWIYLLRERGLWVLDGGSLALRSVLPITVAPPAGLALSPDGSALYLFGNGWLSAQPTAALQSLGIAPVTGGFPQAWTYPESTPAFRPKVFRSPTYDEDGTALALVGGYGELYRTANRGQTWRFVPELTYPTLHYAQQLSLSPDFARDQTLTAHGGGDRPILRSTDGGASWGPWTPPIAFVSDRDGTRQVYTANPDGSGARRVTDGPAASEAPAWSPAWTYIAFQSERAGNHEIYAVRADCDQAAPDVAQVCRAIPLVSSPGQDVLPAWSPDGRLLAFTTDHYGNPELALAPAGLGDVPGPVQRLTDDPAGDWRPAWFPDGRQLAWTGGHSGRNGIYRLTLPAGATAPGTIPPAEPLVVDASDNRDPALNRSGTLLFLSDRDGSVRAYSLILQEYQPAIIYPATPGGQGEAHPSWIDDWGVQIMVAVPVGPAPGIYQADAGRYRPLLVSPGLNEHPAWGPPLWSPDAAASADWLNGLN
jgi:hypothetical protein